MYLQTTSPRDLKHMYKTSYFPRFTPPTSGPSHSGRKPDPVLAVYCPQPRPNLLPYWLLRVIDLSKLCLRGRPPRLANCALFCSCQLAVVLLSCPQHPTTLSTMPMTHHACVKVADPAPRILRSLAHRHCDLFLPTDIAVSACLRRLPCLHGCGLSSTQTLGLALGSQTEVR